MSNKKSSKLEKKVAQDLVDGKVQIASGALPFWKQDIQSAYWLVEHKYTEPWTKGFTLKRSYFLDIIKEAFKLSKSPALVLEFTGNPELKVVVIRYDDFLALDEYMDKELNGE